MTVSGNRDDVVHARCSGDGAAWSRRALLVGAGAGAAGLALSDAPGALAQLASRQGGGTQEVINVASTIEVLTTVITTTALEKLSLPAAAVETVGAASREELDHFDVLTRQFGGHPATRRVWIPDALFATPTALFTGLVVGEQICINLYLVATTIWAAAGHSALARAGLARVRHRLGRRRPLHAGSSRSGAGRQRSGTPRAGPPGPQPPAQRPVVHEIQPARAGGWPRTRDAGLHERKRSDQTVRGRGVWLWREG